MVSPEQLSLLPQSLECSQRHRRGAMSPARGADCDTAQSFAGYPIPLVPMRRYHLVALALGSRLAVFCIRRTRWPELVKRLGHGEWPDISVPFGKVELNLGGRNDQGLAVHLWYSGREVLLPDRGDRVLPLLPHYVRFEQTADRRGESAHADDPSYEDHGELREREPFDDLEQ